MDSINSSLIGIQEARNHRYVPAEAVSGKLIRQFQRAQTQLVSIVEKMKRQRAEVDNWVNFCEIVERANALISATSSNSESLSVQKLREEITKLRAVIESTNHEIANYATMKTSHTMSHKTVPMPKNLGSLNQRVASYQQNLKQAESKLAKIKAIAVESEADEERRSSEVSTLKLGLPSYIGATVAESSTIGPYAYAVCCAQGRRPHMEDRHLVSSFDVNMGGIIYPAYVFSVFDGHSSIKGPGGDAAAEFLQNNLERKLQEKLQTYNAEQLTESGVFNSLKLAFAELHDEFKRENKEATGTTAVTCLLLNGKIWTANVGDSRATLFIQDPKKEILGLESLLDGSIVQLSEDAKPEDPRYKSSIFKRKGTVRRGRVAGVLATARAIGDHDVLGIDPRPKIIEYPLSSMGGKISEEEFSASAVASVRESTVFSGLADALDENPSMPDRFLVIGCDGFFEGADLLEIQTRLQRYNNPDLLPLARDLVSCAYENSSDNISLVIVKLPSN